jgi:hypothetical protein
LSKLYFNSCFFNILSFRYKLIKRIINKYFFHNLNNLFMLFIFLKNLWHFCLFNFNMLFKDNFILNNLFIYFLEITNNLFHMISRGFVTMNNAIDVFIEITLQGFFSLLIQISNFFILIKYLFLFLQLKFQLSFLNFLFLNQTQLIFYSFR